VVVNHHGDRKDGMAHVRWEEDGREREVHVPAALLVELGRQYAFDFFRDELAGFLDQLAPD
jgi:hypothetical protein